MILALVLFLAERKMTIKIKSNWETIAKKLALVFQNISKLNKKLLYFLLSQKYFHLIFIMHMLKPLCILNISLSAHLINNNPLFIFPFSFIAPLKYEGKWNESLKVKKGG